jgi:hypothetical protein
MNYNNHKDLFLLNLLIIIELLNHFNSILFLLNYFLNLLYFLIFLEYKYLLVNYIKIFHLSINFPILPLKIEEIFFLNF